MRFVIVLCALGLLGGTAQAAPPARASVTLPDAGTYTLWVQSHSGPLSILPTTVAQQKTIPLSHVYAGDTLYVLDAHTGQVALRPLAPGRGVVMTVADFKPVAAPAPAALVALTV